MKVAIFNIAKILSGDIASPIAAGDTIVLDDGKIVAVGTGGNVSDCDVDDRRRRHDGDAGPDRFPRPHHLRRLYAAAEDRRLSRKLYPRRRHFLHQRVGGACARPAARSRRRQGAGDRGAQIVRALPPGRHARSCRLGDPRTGSQRRRFRRDGRARRVAGEGRLRRLRDAVRLRALRGDGEAPRHDHDGAHRRLVDPGLGGHLGRSCAQDAAATFRITSTAARSPCRMPTFRGWSTKATSRCRSAPRAICERRCSSRNC